MEEKIYNLDNVVFYGNNKPPEGEYVFWINNSGCRAAFVDLPNGRRCYFETLEEAFMAAKLLHDQSSHRQFPYIIHKAKNGPRPYKNPPVETWTIQKYLEFNSISSNSPHNTD